MNKSLFFIFLNIYSLLIFSAYSTPILLFPKLAHSRSLNSYLVSLVFSAFPLGAFPASLMIGKLMRFYKKDKLLLCFNAIASLARFSFGLLDFIENPILFFAVGFFCRFVVGVSEGCLIPIIYSFIPDLFPDEMMIKFGILEIWGSIGTIIGAPLSSLIFINCSYFAVFSIMSSFNLIVGMFIIIFFLKSDEIISFKKDEKQSLPLKDALFRNKGVLLNFFYLCIFFFPNFLILSGFQNYFSTLTANLYVSAFVYSLILVGMIIGVYVIKHFYEPKYEKIMLFLFGLSVMISLVFYGPDPALGISDATIKIILIAISFLIVGVAIEVIFLIITKKLINELLEVFPTEKELCADFANGLFTTCFTIDQFFGPLTGSLLDNHFGYNRSGTVYAIISMFYFLIYWTFITKRGSYNQMNEEDRDEIEIKT